MLDKFFDDTQCSSQLKLTQLSQELTYIRFTNKALEVELSSFVLWIQSTFICIMILSV